MEGKRSNEKSDTRPEFPTQRFIHSFRFAARSIPLCVSTILVAALSHYLASHHELITAKTCPLPRDLLFFSLPVNGAFVGATILVVGLLCYLLLRRERQRPVYLRDFAVYKPPHVLKVNRQDCADGAKLSGNFNEESLQFQQRIAERAGLGDETYLPPVHHQTPFNITMDAARDEAEMVMFGAVQQLLDQTGLKPRDIDILVVNCSLFNPTPSLSAMIVNNFKMRSDIISYNLSGMGCSAGVIAIGLAKELLQVYPNKNALVVSTENITQNWYFGNDRSMLIPNVLFRMGGAAMYLTNRTSEKKKSKYLLQHVIRVHQGADDKAYRCVFQHPDKDGVIGVELNRDLFASASKALTKNMTKMGPLVLPWTEKLFVALNLIAKRVFKMKVKPYVPDFKTAFQHFCLHAGGRAIIEGLAKQLSLPPEKTEPSFQTLHWYGNTSSSTIWYSLAYAESCQGVKKGDVVWQVGFGSGFKCNSAVWKAINDVNTVHRAWKHRVGKTPSPIVNPIGSSTDSKKNNNT